VGVMCEMGCGPPTGEVFVTRRRVTRLAVLLIGVDGGWVGVPDEEMGSVRDVGMVHG
jgi:hypothetical protein